MSVTWKDAVLQVLEEADEPLHYTNIPDKIAERELRNVTGEIPERTVAGVLNTLVKKENRVTAEGGGMYRINPDGEQVHNDDSNRKSDLDLKYAKFASYGLFWRRDRVNWHQSYLWGRESEKSTRRIDFSKQVGVYLLHRYGRTMYVGQTNESKKPEGEKPKGLFQRLNHHRKNEQRRMHRWDAFSWFGFRRVDDKDELVEEEMPQCEARETN